MGWMKKPFKFTFYYLEFTIDTMIKCLPMTKNVDFSLIVVFYAFSHLNQSIQTPQQAVFWQDSKRMCKSVVSSGHVPQARIKSPANSEETLLWKLCKLSLIFPCLRALETLVVGSFFMCSSNKNVSELF